MEHAQLSGEGFPHAALASFRAREDAEAARRELGQVLPGSEARVQRLAEGDDPDRVLQPESHGIALTLVRSHAWLGLLGALLGGVAFLVLRELVPLPSWAVGYPLVIALVMLGGFAGLLVAGLISLRPDQDRLMAALRQARRDGRPVLVVHTRRADTLGEACETMQRFGGQALRSI